MKNTNIPKHVAIIMDGNGRWAKERKLPRFQGHLAGVRSIEEVVRMANQLGVKVITLFAFSTENWSRPRQEVSMLMKILTSTLESKVKDMTSVRFAFIGSRENVSADVLKSLDWAQETTKDHEGLVLNIAFNYGSRQEIVDAVKRIASEAQEGQIDISQINEELFSRYLYTHNLPDPDLLIRTSGEQRISNFLLWQLSYAELYFTEKFWPDFDGKEFESAVLEYQSRERRYGKVQTLKASN